MNLRPILRRALCAVAVLLLLGLAWWAVVGGYQSWPRAQSEGQKVEIVVQLACGMLGLGVVATRFRWTAASRRVRIAWAASLAATGGLSGLVWGPPMLLVALLFGVVALLVAWGIVRALGQGAL